MTMHDPSFARLVEDEQAEGISLNRRIARVHLRKAATELRLMDRALRRLGEDDLYDTDVVETEVSGLIASARAQVAVGMAALDSAIPEPSA